jgi:hypothetical protein
MVVWQVEEVRQVEGAGQFSEYAAEHGEPLRLPPALKHQPASWGRSLIGRGASIGAQCSHKNTSMQPRYGIATVLCFAATLVAGCAFGLPKRGDGAPSDRASGAGAPAGETARPQETLAMQPEKVGRLKAVLHDFGRYYK